MFPIDVPYEKRKTKDAKSLCSFPLGHNRHTARLAKECRRRRKRSPHIKGDSQSVARQGGSLGGLVAGGENDLVRPNKMPVRLGLMRDASRINEADYSKRQDNVEPEVVREN